MSSTNNTLSEIPERCRFMEPFEWRDEYLTPAVYRNLIITSVVNGVSFPFTALLNAYFILCILLKPNLRRKKSIVLIGYLAVTDLIVGVIVQPLFLAGVLCRISEQCNSCAVDTTCIYLAGVSRSSSFLHITLIAWERYIAIKHALHYNLVVTTKRLLTGSIAAWLISVTLTCIRFVHLTTSRILTATALLTCFAAIVYFYTVIYLESRRHRRQIMATISFRKANKLKENEFKATKTTVIWFGCLLICYGPATVALICRIFSFPANMSNDFISYSWMQTLVMLNSLCNAFIYGWRIQDFRYVIPRIFQMFRCCSTNSIQQSEIELIEFNRSGRLANDSFIVGHNSRCGDVSNNSNDEASKQHKCRCKTAIPLAGMRDSANDLVLKDLSSKAKATKEEGNITTVTAMVHVNCKAFVQQPDVINAREDTDAITKETSCKAKITETTAGFDSQEDIAESEQATAGLVQKETRPEMNDMFPIFLAIIEKIEKEQPDKIAAIRKQNVDVE